MHRLISFLFLLVSLPCLSPPLAAEPRQLYVQPSALAQVVEALRQAPPWAHADLASLTLEALLEAYAAELDESAAERARDAAGQRRLARWRQAVTMQLNDLERFQLKLGMAGHVAVHTDPQGQVLLRLDGSLMIVSWPRVSGQAQREAALVERFCARHACPMLGPVGAARGIEAPVQVEGAWSFSQRGGSGWESEGGVRCAFPDLKDRAGREARCRALAADLETLARVLAQVQREGARIQWQDIRLANEPGGGVQRVTVNEGGDYVLLPLDALALSAGSVDWQAAGRWLEQRVREQRSVETVWSARS